MQTPAGRRATYSWIWIAALWAGLGILDATQNVFSMRHQGMHHSWAKLFIVLTFDWLPWALLTPWVIHLARRFPPNWKSPRTWPVHMGAIAAIGLVASGWSLALELALQPWLPDSMTHQFLATWPLKFAGGLLPALILYAFIIAVIYALDSNAEAAAQQTDTARLNEQLSYARLNALQRQIEPHFLFNTLNSISGLVREQRNDAAVNMIVALSELLRSVAGSSNEAEVPLAREVEFLQQYLNIQAARFAGRLKVELDIPQELQAAQIPNLLLQPLVENALKHGIAQRAQEGTVRVAATRSDGLLHLRVYNDGPLLDCDRHAVKEGIGLANLRTRLKLLHGAGCELRLENYGITGVEASVALPYREA
ncbi:MAG TPA: histidine kinase [Steroidobacteraceae bacterium]|jgi:signal transduction histidine kinase|nr:histidine kinase [Steroidobacteraceae bacterium]